MKQERLEVIKYENRPEWDCLEVNTEGDEWTINSCSDGGVRIECFNTSDGSKFLFLNQEELKQTIEFLQSRVIK